MIMKKLIAVLCMVLVMATMLTACKFTCDICEEEKSGKKQTGELNGKKVVYCEDCESEYKAAEGLLNMFGVN